MDFSGCHFDGMLILQAVRWYCAYALSYRDIEELMEERGVEVDHSTVQRWVVRFAPELEERFRKKKRPTGISWRMDETYIKVKGEWKYYYRAVDKDGNTLDFLLCDKRDKKAAIHFFRKTIGSSGFPGKVNMDKSGSNYYAVVWLNTLLIILGLWPLVMVIRQNKYLNNRIEQDHRGIKRIVDPMMGFKNFEAAQATLSGIELHRMLRKGQCANDEKMPAWQQWYELAA
jgi:putative transposase